MASAHICCEPWADSHDREAHGLSQYLAELCTANNMTPAIADWDILERGMLPHGFGPGDWLIGPLDRLTLGLLDELRRIPVRCFNVDLPESVREKLLTVSALELRAVEPRLVEYNPALSPAATALNRSSKPVPPTGGSAVRRLDGAEPALHTLKSGNAIELAAVEGVDVRFSDGTYMVMVHTTAHSYEAGAFCQGMFTKYATMKEAERYRDELIALVNEAKQRARQEAARPRSPGLHGPKPPVLRPS